MFLSIFKFELRHYLKQYSIYFYTVAFFLTPAFFMAGSAGFFDSPNSSGPAEYLNSHYNIFWGIDFFNRFTLFLLPIIVGNSIYRDYKSDIFKVMFSFPLKKAHYLFGKYISSLSIVIIIVSMIGLGLFLATQLPGLNYNKIGPNNFKAYFETYIFFVYPNMIIYSAIIFATVIYTRNINTGFISIIILLLIQELFSNIFTGPDDRYIAAILDPFGKKAAFYGTSLWTLTEKNNDLLPFNSLILYNRFLWFSISTLIFTYAHRLFCFNHINKSKNQKRKYQSTTEERNYNTSVEIPELSKSFSRFQEFKTCIYLSKFEINAIFKNKTFIWLLFISFIVIFFIQAKINPSYGFKILPVTWSMLFIPAFMFTGLVNMITFLYSGILIQKTKLYNMNQLVDTCPVRNRVLIISKFLSILKIQLVFLFLLMISGTLVQSINHYYNFEFKLYLFNIVLMNFLGTIIWAFLAFFFQTVLNHTYLAFFILLFSSMAIFALPEIGVENPVFRFNSSGLTINQYSDMHGYENLDAFYIYKSYWFLGGFVIFISSSLFWVRGFPGNIKERIKQAKTRFTGTTGKYIISFGIVFVTSAIYIYYHNTINNPNFISNKQLSKVIQIADKKYKQYADMIQPKIQSLKVRLDIFPAKESFKAKGYYILQNKSAKIIDTLLVSTGFDEQSSYQLDVENHIISKDSIANFDILKLKKALYPNDTIKFYFDIVNKPSTAFTGSSNVKTNGTFIMNDIFPRFFYRSQNKVLRHDSAALQYNYQSKDADLIKFEATVSTSNDQIAIGPGYLEKEWEENNRRFFHYKMDKKIKFLFGFNSAKYKVKTEKWNNISLKIYYHKSHNQNLERMMKGMKSSLAYHSKYFSPYQHREARIIEFPVSYGKFATTFANSIPFSELRFITDMKQSSIDFPFYMSAHEVAHQWWGNQVIPANLPGAKMITESLAEYVTLRIFENTYGKSKLRELLRFNLNLYLRGRSRNNKSEKPLIYTNEKQYLSYRKGALVLNSLSHYLGEERLNGALKYYLKNVRDRESNYTTSTELVKYIRSVCPDSLKYLIEDHLETITFYHNYVKHVDITAIGNERYRLKIHSILSKYRTDQSGKKTKNEFELSFEDKQKKESILSLPLKDYIRFGIFDKDNQEITVKEYLVENINTTINIIVDKKPYSVAIDPEYLLIDQNIKDNYYKIKHDE